jgi:hypothetical protein
MDEFPKTLIEAGGYRLVAWAFGCREIIRIADGASVYLDSRDDVETCRVNERLMPPSDPKFVESWAHCLKSYDSFLTLS